MTRTATPMSLFRTFQPMITRTIIKIMLAICFNNNGSVSRTIIINTASEIKSFLNIEVYSMGMKINELKVNTNADVTGKVKAIEDVKQVTTKFGTQVSLTVAVLEDDTGAIKLNLWGSQSDGVQEGSTLEITNGFVKEFKGEKQLSVGKTGSIKIVE